MLATLAIALQLLAAGAGLAQGVGDEAAANRLMVEAVEAWRRAEALRADDLVTVQERLKALRAVDANLKRIVEQHKSSSLAVKLVLGEKLGPLSLDETARAIAASRQQGAIAGIGIARFGAKHDPAAGGKFFAGLHIG